MTTGSRMKARRKELGIPVDKIASALGVSIATVYRYENGDIEKVPGSILEPLSKVLCTTPAYLMGWEDEDGSVDLGLVQLETGMSQDDAIGFINGSGIKAPIPKDERDFAQNEHEERMLLLARHIAPIPEEQRNQLIENFTSAANLYLKLMNNPPEDS